MLRKRPTPQQSLHPPDNESSRLSRRLSRGNQDVSIRSKSMPNVRAETSNHQADKREYELCPTINVQHHNFSTQGTAGSQRGGREVDVELVTPIEKSSNDSNKHATQDDKNGPQRTDSDRSGSNNTTSSPRDDSDNWTESGVDVPPRNLTALDVAALIVNRMVITHALLRSVLAYLPRLGGIWTSLFLLVYLEFGCALPFNGGELIYLDEIYRKPELFVTILFSGFFLVLANSHGNSIQFAKHVLLSAEPSIAKAAELDPRLVLTLDIFLNKLLAWYKIFLLLIFFAAGMAWSQRQDPSQTGRKDFNDTIGQGSSMDGLAAMVLIFYAYRGWENSNYYMVLDYDTILTDKSDLGVALYFAPKVFFGNSLPLKVCITISALGNVLVVAYTFSKVKQAIAVQQILPFYRFLQMDIDTPKGALLLHWVSSVILISVCPTSADGYTFAIGLFTYGHIIISTIAFVAFGLFGLKNRMREKWPTYRPQILTSKWLYFSIPFIVAGGNFVILYFGAKPRDAGKIPRFWWPVSFFFIMGGSFLYWAVMMATQIPVKVKGKKKRLGQIIGFEVNILKENKVNNEELDETMEEAIVRSRLDGSKRRVRYRIRGNGHPQLVNHASLYSVNRERKYFKRWDSFTWDNRTVSDYDFVRQRIN
ncbi:hypothetical protein K469DRAFT_696908 [Zopfia rhizophila CBS 207.26]|uniref:Uncharacterized protein n=1 Tax=Zopfia rhizophila CBS 207.26 TaxID=1314779 RepID=A0A6A6EM58_9PEZI|nr:hypothetical protein K469DRAFT_696908 [Zopfia rhizophila CBS 207.26]